MAISRISGRILKANLERDSNLAFNTNSLVIDYSNNRVGIGTASPSSKFEVSGDMKITGGNQTLDQITIAGNKIESTVSNANLQLDANGTGIIELKTGTTIDGSLTLQSGVQASSILDEDNFASDSATALATQQSIKAYVTTSIAGSTQSGMQTDLGVPTDSSLRIDGAYQGWTTTTKVTDAIDDLNEVTENIRNNTFVKSVTFVADVTAAGAGTNITLTITTVGNPNRFDVTWGDGNSDTNITDSTPSHVYSTNSGSPFSVTVKAYNNLGSGSGSEASLTRTDYITIFTATPVAQFQYFRASSGGSALSGNDLYVVEGNSLYLDNNTTNIGAASAAYTVNWGDGTAVENITADTNAGGTQGDRLQHTWGAGTQSGTSRDTTTLTLTSHSTATPSDIPTSGTVSLKVYDDAIAAPNGLSTKTLTFSSAGTNPKLAHGFTDRTGGATVSAGDTVNRTIGAGSNIESDVMSSFAYNADAGNLIAKVNGSADGTIALSTGNDAGTNSSLTITQESDYNLLNASGSTVSFASSIYYPTLYDGFKAKVSKSSGSVNNGVNSYQLSHSVTGDTNVLEFVKDDLTATPVTDISGATLAQGTAGTFRYVSGIPYYNAGSPTLTVAGTTITNLVGQVYTDQSNIVEIDSGTNQEGTSSNAITNTDYTYANIDGSTTMLASGIPKVNTGTSSAYAIGTLTVPITSSSVRTVERIKVRARNVNGTGNYSSDIATNIQVHTASQSGISEIAIPVSDSLGSTYDDDGVRIFNFSNATTNNPTYTNSTNFYTNSLYTEATDPGVAGTKEASVRLGAIKYDVTNYSTGYLPAGPNRSSDTGTQYFTFAFRRQVVANFDIAITSSGIAGLWIAAPGTAIDNSSGINGWLEASVQYAGAGVPGSNTGAGGNGSNGCAQTGADIIAANASLNSSYTMTLGSENMSNATNNVVLVRIALTSGQSVTALSVGVAS